MKLHASRYGLTAAMGAITTGLLCISFGYIGLVSGIFVGLLCTMIIPFEQQGDS